MEELFEQVFFAFFENYKPSRACVTDRGGISLHLRDLLPLSVTQALDGL